MTQPTPYIHNTDVSNHIIHYKNQELNYLYYKGVHWWDHPDGPTAPLRWSITPTSDTARTGIITWIYAPSEDGITSEIIARTQGQDTTILTSQLRNRQTNNANYTSTFTRPADEDITFILRQTKNNITIEYILHFTFLVAGAITNFGPIRYGPQTPAGGIVQIPITIPFAFRGKTMESATITRPSFSSNALHLATPSAAGYEYTGTFRDTLTVGVGVVNYELTVTVNGITVSRTISTRSL